MRIRTLLCERSCLRIKRERVSSLSSLFKCCTWHLMRPSPPPLPLSGLWGLTSIIGRRTEPHYTVSALCLSIRVTEEGPGVWPHTKKKKKKHSRREFKALFEDTSMLDLQSLDARRRSRRAVALRWSPISHVRWQVLPRGLVYNKGVRMMARNLPCPFLIAQNANTRGKHKRGYRETLRGSGNWFCFSSRKRPTCTWSLDPEFPNCNIKHHRGIQTMGTSERKMRV